MCISFTTQVPVLSGHRMAAPAVRAITARRVTIIPCLANALGPSASVVVVTMCMAVTMEAMLDFTAHGRASTNATMLQT